ncbi:dimethylmenaquinone methyltransferase [Arthrobacter sp. RIT-PI-e]|uniref:RraA family protein n=1 Tax=Arthrobacter sp. RIT-PI-e TaxID=1681197 RepID=UPI0006761544|nr:RraA family protein [Arthrobacter sp. RIT-PI-e]KNC18863.1 dimethylmenaquinone methyltransferase [Arthrobacter sp. RIT-PI-e]
MDAETLQRTYLDLSTPHVADACMRLGIPVRCAPTQVRPLWPGTHVVGTVRPARHYGSVDVFLEAIDQAAPGDVLVVDNGGRTDEACVGDLITLEAQRAGLAGIIIWGLHRDTLQLLTIRLPVLSLGTLPVGPQRLDARDPGALTNAACGEHTVDSTDFALADDDGALFIPLEKALDVATVAAGIRDTERRQAAAMLLGTSFRTQSRLPDYIAARHANPNLTFRQHLRTFGGEIEE